ncbi:MAG TPA: ABC transporter substrate-binding protein [Solirubrobacterales bacterium]|nr:ABC transporter substrate-binding protein [Solirubrobacterales bacterium]
MSRLRLLLLLGATVVVALLGGCGGGSETSSEVSEKQNVTLEDLHLNLDWDPGPEDVGPLLADQLGYFRDARIRAEINSPILPERPTKYTDEKLVDAAIVQEPQVVLAREEGRPIVIFGALVPTANLAIIWPSKSGIESIADLKGKTIAYPGVPFQKDFLEYVLAGAGLTLADVKLDDVGYDLVPALASGRADAIFGGSANEEGTFLEARGLDPVVTEVTKLGVPGYDELVLIARRDRYTENPKLFQRLLDASIRGNEAATEDTESATETIVSENAEEGAVKVAKPAQAGVEATAPLLSENGEIDRARLKRLVDWMYEEGMIERRWSVSQLVAGP